MIHAQHPPSMSSAALPNIHKQDGGLPRLTGWKDFQWGADRDQGSRRVQRCSHTPPQGQSYNSASCYAHGLTTPPGDGEDMNGSHGNPLHNPAIGRQPYQRVPVVASNAPPYPSAHSTLENNKERGTVPRQAPFYDCYYSAKRPQSPVVPQKVSQNEQNVRRKASSDGNSIASHLQIPSSINDSKGSLPEFAAQITCFFWFESSFTIHQVEDATSSPVPITPLVPEAMPTTGFRKWVTTILSMTQVSQNVILLALMFIYRLKKLNPGVKGKVGSEFRLLTVALMLGNKFLDDNTYTNKTWAEVSGISVQEIHVMEVEFLSNMRYTLYASEDEWKAWHAKLGDFSNYYDKAAQSQIGLRSLALPMPQYTTQRDLPSPPVSTNTSPPYLTRPSPYTAALPHPLSMPPYLASKDLSPISTMSEVDSKPWSRKRSIEDQISEPPAKRLHSLGPSAASSTTLTPSTLRDITPPVPRLPMPNLSVSTGHSQNGYSSTPGQLPVPPGRAMANIFPTSNSRPQIGLQLPCLQPSNYMNQPGSAKSSSPMEYQSRQTPYSTAASTPSPTSYAFPAHQATPTGLSPSGWPAPRTSPYKPVRGVNTLLVPPPSTSIQNHPQNVSHGQMHYQPLGKPISERRTGVLPYFPFNTFSQPHHMQHYLPQPSFAS